MQRRHLLSALTAVTLASTGMGTPAWAAEPLKILIGANPGGGYDQLGRGIGKAIQESGAAGTVTYENKGGAGGTIALAQFANASKGDSNQLLVTGLVMVGAIVQNKPPVSLKDITPIARLQTEYNVFVVPADSPIKTMAQAVEQMKKDPGSVKWGGGSKGSVDHVSVAMIASDIGVPVEKMNYVPFKGGGEAVAAVLGGHVSVGTSGLAELAEFIKSGKLRALAVTAPTRLAGVDIPTLREQKINVDIGNWRGLHAGPGITPAQRQALIDAVVKGSKTPGWAQTLSTNGWTSTVLTGDDFGKFVEAENARMQALMSKLGML